MNISERSMIFRFQRDALVAMHSADEPDRYIPTNLCPYMRRFLRLAGATAVVALVACIAIVSMLWYPIVWLLNWPFLDLFFFAIFGIALWITAIGFSSHHLYKTYGKNNARYIAAQLKLKALAKTAWRPIGKRIDCNIFFRWYRAVHDKICPHLSFYDD